MAARFVRIGSPKTILETTITAMKKPYHIVDRGSDSCRRNRRVRQANGQILLPLVELVTQARVSVDKVIDRIGRQTIETF